MPSNQNGSRFGRRRMLKIVGAASITGVGATKSAAASRRGPQVIRIEGSYDDPIEPEQARNALEEAAPNGPNVRPPGRRRADPEYGDGYEIVDYVARIGPEGKTTRYYAAAAEGEEETAHAKADDREKAFHTSDVTIASSPPVDEGPDWVFLDDFQTSVSDHWGSLNHNMEWWYVGESDQERNAFRCLVGSTDDTWISYDRAIESNHDYGAGDLTDKDFHSTGPDQTHDDGYTVSIGYPSGGSLSWEAGGSGDVDHTIDNSDITANWKYDIPDDGTKWFFPGSHVNSDPSSVGDHVISARADAYWGDMYNLYHTWNLKR